MLRQLPHIRKHKKAFNVKIEIKILSNRIDDPYGLDRTAADSKKVIVNADGLDLQQILVATTL